VDSDARVVNIAVKWPGATNDITCFRNMRLFEMLRDGIFPNYVHIVADEAYAGVCKECCNQILTPYIKLQLTAASSKDKENIQNWESRVESDPLFNMEPPVEEYWKMRAFNHELSSERITVERVLGMLVCCFGILWKPIEMDITKVPTIFLQTSQHLHKSVHGRSSR
jgi:DDE superfamily endonuclease